MIDEATKGQKERAQDIAILQSLSVCPYGLITQLSWEAYYLWQSCDGTRRVSTPKEFSNLPAMYVHACQIIEDETGQWVKHD